MSEGTIIADSSSLLSLPVSALALDYKLLTRMTRSVRLLMLPRHGQVAAEERTFLLELPPSPVTEEFIRRLLQELGRTNLSLADAYELLPLLLDRGRVLLESGLGMFLREADEQELVGEDFLVGLVGLEATAVNVELFRASGIGAADYIALFPAWAPPKPRLWAECVAFMLAGPRTDTFGDFAAARADDNLHGILSAEDRKTLSQFSSDILAMRVFMRQIERDEEFMRGLSRSQLTALYITMKGRGRASYELLPLEVMRAIATTKELAEPASTPTEDRDVESMTRYAAYGIFGAVAGEEIFSLLTSNVTDTERVNVLAQHRRDTLLLRYAYAVLGAQGVVELLAFAHHHELSYSDEVACSLAKIAEMRDEIPQLSLLFAVYLS